MNEIFEKVKEMIVEQLDIEEDMVTSDASFADDLEADSLDVVELMMSIEEEFNIEISDDDADNISTVGEAVAYIAELL